MRPIKKNAARIVRSRPMPAGSGCLLPRDFTEGVRSGSVLARIAALG
jgi:hypothetical protein